MHPLEISELTRVLAIGAKSAADATITLSPRYFDQ
jgi:hypothetical protein